MRETAGAMEAEGITVASWVKEMLDAGNESFYKTKDGIKSYYDAERKSYIAEPLDERKIKLSALKSIGQIIRKNKGASLIIFDLKFFLFNHR